MKRACYPFCSLKLTMIAILQSVILAIAITAVSGSEDRFINVVNNKKCVTKSTDYKRQYISAGSGKCEELCKSDIRCVSIGIKFLKKGEACYMYDTEVIKMEDAEGFSCGRAKVRIGKKLIASLGGKDFHYYQHSECGGPLHVDKIKVMPSRKNFSQCQMKCNKMKKCKSFQWERQGKICTLYKYKVKKISSSGSDSNIPQKVCSVLRNTCRLEATLGFPYENPDHAPLGYDVENLVVTKHDGTFCSGDGATFPDWCHHHAEIFPWGAHILNIEDCYYHDGDPFEENTKEYMTVSVSGGRTLTVRINQQWMVDDKFTDDVNLEPHESAAVLHVKNLSKGGQQLSASGWSHPVGSAQDVVVKIKCFKNCFCKAV